MKCYLLLFNDDKKDEKENIKTIMDISNKYLSTNNHGLYPMEKLKLFSNLTKLLQQDNDNAVGKKYHTLENKQNTLKTSQCSLSFDIDTAKKELSIYSNLVKKCNVHFYEINTELLFSIDPFTLIDKDNDNNQLAFNYISPSQIWTKIALNDGQNTTIGIPK